MVPTTSDEINGDFRNNDNFQARNFCFSLESCSPITCRTLASPKNTQDSQWKKETNVTNLHWRQSRYVCSRWAVNSSSSLSSFLRLRGSNCLNWCIFKSWFMLKSWCMFKYSTEHLQGWSLHIDWARTTVEPGSGKSRQWATSMFNSIINVVNIVKYLQSHQ